MNTEYQPGIIAGKFGKNAYGSPPGNPIASMPTTRFFLAVLNGPLLLLWRLAKHGKLDDAAWSWGSQRVAEIFEELGGKIHIEGLENIDPANGPYVFIGNHMSTMETFLLPGIIRPIMPVTFVVKKSLTTMPVFGHVMRSRDPVVVERKSARDDLATTLREGTERLGKGISIVVFPQHTRSIMFDATQFNTIGVKLARKAGVRVLPVALKTDAWGQGKKIKELGKVRPDLPVRFKFGASMPISGPGKDEHATITNFIADTVEAWQQTDGINQ